MLRGEIDATAAAGPEALVSTYGDVLRETIQRVDGDRIAKRTGLERETVDRVLAGDVADVTLEEAAAILATDPDRPDAETIAAEARDILLLGMTTAVLDVDTLASQLDAALGPKEIQQKIEGRYPMTLGEYATVHYHLRAHAE